MTGYKFTVLNIWVAELELLASGVVRVYPADASHYYRWSKNTPHRRRHQSHTKPSHDEGEQSHDEPYQARWPIARDLAPSLIRCVTVAPGFFDTPLLGGLPDKVRDRLSDAVPHPRRLGSPTESAALVLHIVKNPYINADVVRIDGPLRLGYQPSRASMTPGPQRQNT